jgi:ankyrin repeat protein/nucleoside phosphorylase
MPRQLRREDYTVGWVCALPVELAAAQEMLDEEHGDLERDLDDNDENLYALGSIGGHNVAIVCLPAGRIGNNPAAAVATQMRATFKGIRFGLMVGIGGGVPSAEADIWLGDVVISQPHQTFGGVVQYGMGKATPSGFERIGSLNSPPQMLLAAVARVRANELRGRSRLSEHVSKLNRIPKFQRSKTGPDVLFEAIYDHEGGQTCEQCSTNRQEARQPRESEEEVVVHYGTIASGNQVMRNATERDKVSAELGGVLCFEMEAAGLMNSFPCLVIRGICDYADSHKNKKWQAYAAGTAAACAKEVLLAISPAGPSDLEQTRPSLKRRDPMKREGREKLLNSLEFRHIEDRYNSIPVAHSATCKWLLTNENYLAWLDESQISHHHGFLWLKGNPGTGKSTIIKFALSEAKRSRKDEVHISFFFNARGSSEEKDTRGMYRSLLFQLLTKLPEAQEVFNDFDILELPRDPHYSWTIPQLKAVLDRAIRHLGRRWLWIYVDALDECDRDQIRDMVDFFNLLGDHAVTSNINMRVFFASRHYPRITIPKKVELILENEEEHSRDIERYIQSELRTGNNTQSVTVQEIREEVKRRASGIFIWVVLVVEILNKAYEDGQIIGLKGKLREIPDNLGTLFKEILTRDGQNMEATRLCIQWILFAERPLTREELYFAIHSGTHPEEVGPWNREEITTEIMDAFILSCSKGLAQLTKSWSATVQFIHETIRDFFLKEDGMQYIQGTSSQSLLGSGHDSLKQCCVNYISSTLGGSPKPFIRYAQSHVLDHANVAEANGVSQAPFLQEVRVRPRVHFRKFPARSYPSYSLDPSLLYVLAEQNLKSLIEATIRIDPRVDTDGERYGPPIRIALERSYYDALGALLSLGPADESAIRNLIENYYYWCTLGGKSAALVLPFFFQWGDESDAITLLRSGRFGLDFNISAAVPHSPLSIAVQRGYKKLVTFLLGRHDVNPDRKDSSGFTPLSIAAREGRGNIAPLLVECAKVNVNSQCSAGRTPLSYAAEKGHEDVVKLLLRQPDVKVNLRDNNERTPLLYAARRGHEGIVGLLINTRGVDIVSRDVVGQTALSNAVLHGHESVVRQLLNARDVDINSRDTVHGRTPLLLALQYGYKSIANLLLNRPNIDVKICDNRNRTPFDYARDRGMYEEAEVMNRRALEASERVLGNEHPDTLASVGSLASVLRDQGKYEEAEAMNRRALEAREKVLGNEPISPDLELND